MNPVIVIAGSAVREHMRRKLIIVFLGISAVVTALMIYLALASEERNLIVGEGVSIPSVMSRAILGNLLLVAALAVSMGNVGRPFSDGEALVVLARPVAPWQYALGRYLGSLGVIWGLAAVIAVELQAVALIDGEGFVRVLWEEWYAQAFNMSVVASIATLISVMIPVPVAVAVLTWLSQAVFGGVEFAYRLFRAMPRQFALESAISVIRLFTPKFLTSPIELAQAQEMGSEAVVMGTSSAELIPPNSVGIFLWAVSYLVVLLTFTLWLVNRREVR